MPLLYTNKQTQQMKTLGEITQEEFDAMRIHHRKIEYTPSEAAEVFNLVKLYVDRNQQTCITCHTNLRDAKTKLNGFYLENKETFEKIFEDRNRIAMDNMINIGSSGEVEEDFTDKKQVKFKTKSKK